MGFISNLVKYTLFGTNLLIFVLGVAVLGCGIWVLVDSPSFLDILNKAQDVCGDNCDGMDSTIDLYASASYILIVISALVLIIAFFGCCGAIKENKCMLGTYFTIILALFIVMVVGAVLGYSGNLETAIKNPLEKALQKYDDNPPNNSPAEAYKAVWNEVQKELKCCGVNNVYDWKNGSFSFPSEMNKPVGCCQVGRENDLTGDQQIACRKSLDGPQSATYYFEGCYTAMKRQVEENQNVLVGVAIGVVVVMFLNMLFSFALCTMVK